MERTRKIARRICVQALQISDKSVDGQGLTNQLAQPKVAATTSQFQMLNGVFAETRTTGKR